MPRLFFAIPLPPAIKEELHHALRQSRHRLNDLPGVRWVPDGNLHITVLFLGEVKIEILEEILSRGSLAASRIPPFELVFHSFEVQCRNERPTMIWARYYLHPPFRHLFEELATAPVAHGADDPVPHITLARIRQLKQLPTKLSEGGSFNFMVKRLELWNSVTDPGGARYNHVAGWELGWKNSDP